MGVNMGTSDDGRVNITDGALFCSLLPWREKGRG